MPDLGEHPSLEHLRTQASQRQREQRSSLNRAQREIAAGYGFPSWTRLVHHVRATGLQGPERALALADQQLLGSLLHTDPTLAVSPLSGVPALLRLLRDSVGAPADVRGCAEQLLEAGADPTATVSASNGEWELTTSYFAVERSDLSLLRLLLQHGAPRDDDAFYHACERGGTDFLDPLYQPGYEDMLNHQLDFEDEAGIRWFLDHGADVNALGSLHWAIGRGRSVDVLRLLLAAGADPDLPHPDVGTLPLQAAARCGHLAAYELLRGLGATGQLDAVSRAVLAVARGESTQLPDDGPPMPGIPGEDSRWLLGQLALLGRTTVVRDLLDAGLAVDSRGWSNFTPLDQAAMHGRAETVRLLIERGADLEDCAFGEEGPTPLDSAVWGWRNNRAADGDYVGTVAALVQAGAPTRHTPPTGHPEIDALLTTR